MTHHTPKIILWDVHEVLFTRNLAHWMWIILKYPHKWRIIKSLDFHIIKLAIQYILHVLRIKRIELSSQELVDYARRTGKQDIVNITIQVGCDYTPIKGVIALVKQLHSLGYTQHIGSNLGSTVLATFHTMYPDIFCYFDVIQIAHYQNNVLIKKPDTRFFTDYCTKYSLTPSNILFIDDKIYNIIAAEQTGIKGILFENTTQLTTELQKYNIPVQ